MSELTPVQNLSNSPSYSNLRKKFETQLNRSKLSEPTLGSTYFNGDNVKENDKLLFALLSENNTYTDTNSHRMSFITLNERHLDMFDLNMLCGGTDNIPIIQFKLEMDELNFLKSYSSKVQ